jgi:lysozyme
VLHGIDISDYQADLDLNDIAYDFVVIKATEGVGFVSASCEKHYRQAKIAGKLRGVYHFARNDQNTAEDEARFFVDRIRGYIGEALLVLDWEQAPSDVDWAHRWLSRVEELAGVKPLVYMSESVVNGHDWSAVVAGDYGLWVAKYRDYVPDSDYDMSQVGDVPSIDHWPFYVMWQWTSAGRISGYPDRDLDCNVFYGDAEAWAKYCGGGAVVSVGSIQTSVTSSARETRYSVREGDCLSTIGERLGVSWGQIAAVNGLQPPYAIYPGQDLIIP